MNFHDRKVIPPKYIYLFLTVVCIILLLLSVIFESRFSALKSITGALITPMQSGVNAVGSTVHSGVVDRREKKALIAENKELTEKLEEYSAKAKQYEQQQYELKRLEKLLDLQDKYSDYKTVGANVIATDSTNWFYTFIIDKGTESGVKVGCNILADGGLAGIVTEVGNGYSKVRSIIDDNSKISATISGSDSLCTISGDISSMKNGFIHVNYINKADVIDDGAEIITSHVSNKYLPGLLIGYVSDVAMDSNNLTQSGRCIPVVDFTNLHEVLIILDLKTTYKTNTNNKNIYDSINREDIQVPEEDGDSDSIPDGSTGDNGTVSNDNTVPDDTDEATDSNDNNDSNNENSNDNPTGNIDEADSTDNNDTSPQNNENDGEQQ
ncbi:MAG: rod shape-determining protein MreC [Lachnospiraceae bacterium]|nr:rod shape-determining protein MreC [Lachnospiraceae bacterium]